jgi:hypothetical protein
LKTEFNNVGYGNFNKMSYIPPNKREGFVSPLPRPSPFGSSRGRREEDPYEQRKREREIQQLLAKQEEERKENELRTAIATRDINHFPSLGGGGGGYNKQQTTNGGSFAEKAKQWKEQRELIEAQQEEERKLEEARLRRIADRERADDILRSKISACNRRTGIVNPVQEEETVILTDQDGWTTVKPKERKVKKFNYDEIPEEEPQKKKEEDEEFPVYDAEYERY